MVAVTVVVLVAIVAIAAVGVVLTRPAGSSPGAALPAPHLVEETATAGLDHTYGSGTTFDTGGGVAVFDCDADGRPDVFVAGGSRPAALFHNDSGVGTGLRFSARPDPVTDLSAVTGAYPLDIDGDGTLDLAVLRAGENVLLRGLGDCRFERANEAWGFDGGSTWSTAFSARWEAGAHLPTLAVGDYVRLDATGKPTFDCADDQVYVPAADADSFPAPTTLSPGYCALSMVFSDWDRSGRRDLRVSNDRHYYTNGMDQLWRIDPGTRPRQYTPDDGWIPLQIWGMGIGSYDLTGDGYPDYYLTSQGDNKLQTLKAGAASPTYRDIAAKAGVTAAQPVAGDDPRPSTAWDPVFADVNDDGFVDLLLTKGNVNADPEYAAKDPTQLFLGQPDGTFVDATEAAGILHYERGRGAALVDLDLDGRLDLIEVHLDAPVRVWRNVGAGDASAPAPMGHWLAVRLTQPAPNPDAAGAWIEVRMGDTVLRRELTVGGGHIGGDAGWTHFGVRSSERVDVRAIWPDGEEGPWQSVATDGWTILDRGAARPTEWRPPGG
jgi:hypothetical protein